MDKRKPVLAPKNICTGCMACVDRCAQGALQGQVASDGHLYVVCDLQRCNSCGRCERVCPQVNGFQYERVTGCSQPYAAWANEERIRQQGASGGLFGAVASQFLRNGGWVVGASLQGMRVEYRMIHRLEELSELQNSKYQQGDLTGLYRAVESRLREGERVLFSGTPCQVAGMLSFVGDRYPDQLFTLVFICGGFPSLLPLRAFCEHHSDKIERIVSFRNKNAGWLASYKLTLATQDGRVLDCGTTNLVTATFSSHLANRDSCLSCRFAIEHRRSDMTLADFWGDCDFPEEHQKGISVVITHSPHGESLLRQDGITYHPTTLSKILVRNHRLVYGYFPFRYHPAHLLIVSIFKYAPYKILEKIYGARRISHTDLLMFPFKVANFITVASFERAKKRFMSRYK